MDSKASGKELPGIFPIFLLVTTIALVSSQYFDRGTTIAVHGTVVLSACVVTSATTMLVILWDWFRPRENLRDIPHWRRKQVSPGSWVLVGITAALVCGAYIAYLAYTGVRITTQHLAGHQMQVAATVTATRKLTGKRRVCNHEASFTTAESGNFESCMVPRYGSPLVDSGAQIGDHVTLVIVENALGTAVAGIVVGK